MKSRLLGLIFLGLSTLSCLAQEKLRAERDRLVEKGRWREALTCYEDKLLPIADAKSGDDWRNAVGCLSKLEEWTNYDSLLERAVAAHPRDAEFLIAAGETDDEVPHGGVMVAGQFQRGYGLPSLDQTMPGANCEFRDRVQSLQLFRQAVSVAKSDKMRAEAWSGISGALVQTRGEWKLQTLTSLEVLPDWDEAGPSGDTEGAPWSGDHPLLYDVPASWDTARNDGERWRFALAERARLDPPNAARSILGRARFAVSQFGSPIQSQGFNRSNTDFLSPINGTVVQSIPGNPALDVDSAQESLKDDECLAMTSDGIRRFKLAPDQHFIALYRSILADKLVGGEAGDELVQVYLTRRQFDRAETVLRETMSKHGDDDSKSRATLLNQITGAWGRFEDATTPAAGTRPVMKIIFRNAASVKFTAAPIRIEKLLHDIQSYLQSNPSEFDSNLGDPGEIGRRLVMGKEGKASKYLGWVTAKWQQDLKPLDRHRDTHVSTTVPLDQPGAWWVTATFANGNVVHSIVWITDTVLLQHNVQGSPRFFVSDAATGSPVSGTEVEFFGYRMVETQRKGKESGHDIKTKSFTRTTDGEGVVSLQPADLDPDYQWMEIATTTKRGVAFAGFGEFPGRDSVGETVNRNVGYGVTDRPLYKAGETMHLKFWLREVGYGKVNESRWAGKTGRVVLTDGRDQEVLKIDKLKTDAMGAVEVEAVLPKNATLGKWTASFIIRKQMTTAVTFSVEEYRKPEYQVTVEAPTEPVRLGESFKVTVKAAYFHGAPVRKATVDITVRRDSLDERWFPAWQWDWLYGAGAWWTSTSAPWHPGWADWGCVPPAAPWMRGGGLTPTELVLKRQVALGDDGTATIEIDTSSAKAGHGDRDANYTIEANVVDASRREERGSGRVVVARKPFEVVVAADRGWGRPGSDVNASIAAATLTGKVIAGAEGSLRLLRLETGKGGHIDEKEVAIWQIKTGAEGEVKQRFQAPAAGQYRLAAKLSFKGGPAVEGAIIFDVFGSGKPDANWHFGELELIPDKASYAAGETVRLRVNSDHENANVWLFLRSEQGGGREAKRVVLDGKSGVIEVPLTRNDMPNVFIEAVSIYGAEVHSEVRQILLPPESRLLDVKVEPAKPKVKPREKSSLAVTIHDSEGKPFRGTATVAVYDKSLEALTGGSNVGPIRENFWSWKRSYWSRGYSHFVPSWDRTLVDHDQESMDDLAGGGVNNSFGFSRNGNFIEGGNVTNILTSGLRSGDSAINRNSIDAVLNNPNRTAMPKPSPGILSFAGTFGAADIATLRPQLGGPPVLVRNEFADLLKWSGEVKTDADGKAEIPLEFPDNLTTWKARVWALGDGTKLGEGSAEIITSKDLLVRLEAPRFVVEKDEAVLSAVVHNDHEGPESVTISLELEGGVLERIEGETRTVKIPAKGESRVDWRVRAAKEGEALIRMKALAADDGDAMEKKVPVIVHGMLRQQAWSRVVDPDKASATIDFEVPEQRRADQTKLTVNFSPTVAGAVVDAIPYLAAYPYGCTEQTLDRFVPAVIAQKMVKDLGVSLDEVRQKRNNLNPQELGDPKERAAHWQQWRRNPVFDSEEMARMVRAGTSRLGTMQNKDGGWGWFSGFREYSYAHATAVVVHGLLIAKSNGAEIPAGMIERGVAWLAASEEKEAVGLKRYAERIAAEKAGRKPKASSLYEKVEADAADAFVRMVLGEAGKEHPGMTGWLYRDRLSLPVYARCLLGLELHRTKDAKRRDEVMATIAQFLKRDDENKTDFLDVKSDGYWWFWYGSDLEANSWYLKLLSAVTPKAPETRGLVKYLINSRRHASYWNSTRDTAYAVEAIAGYLKASGELAPKMDVEVLLDGKSLRKVSIDKENLFSFDGRVQVEAAGITSGKHSVELRRTGGGALYGNAYLAVFSLEDFLRKAGLEVKVERHVYKLIRDEQQGIVPDSKGVAMAQREEKLQREELKDGDILSVGSRVEVELVLESKNDYEYLRISDAKAAGFEAIETLSGYLNGKVSAYMEPHDRSVDFFIRSLPRGTSRLSYELRAEAPGRYHALPATADAMYAPELRANSDEIRLQVEEK